VRLVGRNGNSLGLVPIRYEFPGDKSDDDWVVIDGRVTASLGSWEFHAALLTLECPFLGTWLAEAARSQVPPTEPDDDPSLTFLEPSLAFSVASYGEEVVTLRAHLSHQAAPPWQDIDDKLNTWTFFIELTVGNADLEAAVIDWDRESAAFPRRPSK
jgi:hypothetical protein